jgi:hypothetical protein
LGCEFLGVGELKRFQKIIITARRSFFSLIRSKFLKPVRLLIGPSQSQIEQVDTDQRLQRHCDDPCAAGKAILSNLIFIKFSVNSFL